MSAFGGKADIAATLLVHQETRRIASATQALIAVLRARNLAKILRLRNLQKFCEASLPFARQIDFGDGGTRNRPREILQATRHR
jgi:hypothetical protein